MTSLVFRALEAANPLAFLAALGAFRLSALSWPNHPIRLRWMQEGGLRPEISGVPATTETDFCRLLHEESHWAPLESFSPLGNNINVPRETFQMLVLALAASTTAPDRRAADFAASFGSDIFYDKEKNRIDYTDLCFITGSGHQHFLGTARNLAKGTTPEHLHEALFGPWCYRDKGLSLHGIPMTPRNTPSVGAIPVSVASPPSGEPIVSPSRPSPSSQLCPPPPDSAPRDSSRANAPTNSPGLSGISQPASTLFAPCSACANWSRTLPIAQN